MAGIRKAHNGRPNGPAAPFIGNDDGGNVHYLFFVRNMFLSVFRHWPVLTLSGRF